MAQATSVLNGFKRILSEYKNALTQPQKNHPLGQFVRRGFVEDLYSSLNIPFDTYLITGSVGKGNWAFIPWVSIFDRSITTSATQGIYLVFLFQADMSGFYLSINQGYTYFKEKYGPEHGKTQVEKAARIHRQIINVPEKYRLPTIDLKATNDLAKGYQKGHIYGIHYDTTNFPSEDEFIEDFNVLLDAYKKIKINMNNRSIKEYNDFLLLDIDNLYLENNEENYQLKANNLAVMREIMDDSSQRTIPRPPKDLIIDETGRKRYPRDANVAARALRAANHKCMIDPEHATFISNSTGKPYTEAHHIVPISNYDQFTVDIDVEENVVSLCAGCHRKIHYGINSQKFPMLELIYQKIKNNLEAAGINVNLDDIKRYYS